MGSPVYKRINLRVFMLGCTADDDDDDACCWATTSEFAVSVDGPKSFSFGVGKLSCMMPMPVSVPVPEPLPCTAVISDT